MQLDNFLTDATECGKFASERQKHFELARMLTEDGSPATPKMVANWFLRGNIPTKWLFMIVRAAEAEGRILDINQYAPEEA